VKDFQRHIFHSSVCSVMKEKYGVNQSKKTTLKDQTSEDVSVNSLIRT